MSSKIYYNLDFENAKNLHWYIGLYLGATRIFMGIVKNKIIQSENVDAILIPVYTVKDPVTDKTIDINITNCYFFLGTITPLHSELELGIKSHLGTITIMRDENELPKQIGINAINQIIQVHKHKKRDTLQERVPVIIKSGTFKSWEGVVVEKTNDSPDKVKVNFTSDEYNFALDMPIALCEPA